MVICHKGEFIIFKAGEDFIAYNTKKTFRNGHTHLKSMSACVAAIKLVRNREMPRSKSRYFHKSLIRLSTDQAYIERLKDLSVSYKRLMEDNQGIRSDKCR